MNESNTVNKDNRQQNQVKGNAPHRSPANRHHSNHPQHTNQNHSSNVENVHLLEEIVQQNHTIIGLLRGIRHALTSGESHNSTAITPVHQQIVATFEPAKLAQVQPIQPEQKQVEPPLAKAIQQKKQFVMRFDDKAPLKLDEQSEMSAVGSEKQESYIISEDENSVGEANPFELFGKHGE